VPGRRCFGSWCAALQAAAVDPESVKTQVSYTREKVIQTQRHCVAGDPGMRRQNRPEESFVKAARCLFGSWQAALDAAGVARKACPNWRALGKAAVRS
jgi:hypothetical protein